ncbi:hypothetical protein HA051_08260 [Chromobacterium vaccinii]|uniref:hypothetical protein n=1 Tax=Chromobacterium violaceum TaxID=536 RepID=UPI00140CDF27|nr:hypothetical protein [Chromobacterium violaceum]MBA8735331.1 hypothetical protein [Chromobacterium violaceum]NHQ81566.1 hypothetical protein [Chromobacterium vaccinii]
MASDSDRAGGWRFDKRINLGDVLTTLALVGTLAGFMLTLDRRLTVLEEKQVQQALIDRQQDERLSEVRGTLKDIDAKLSQMLERLYQQGRAK